MVVAVESHSVRPLCPTQYASACRLHGCAREDHDHDHDNASSEVNKTRAKLDHDFHLREHSSSVRRATAALLYVRTYLSFCLGTTACQGPPPQVVLLYVSYPSIIPTRLLHAIRRIHHTPLGPLALRVKVNKCTAIWIRCFGVGRPAPGAHAALPDSAGRLSVNDDETPCTPAKCMHAYSLPTYTYRPSSPFGRQASRETIQPPPRVLLHT